MGRKLKSLVLVSITAFSLLMPVSGHAAGLVASPECTGRVPDSCTTTFNIPAGTALTAIYPHGDFHELLVSGNVVLQWYDSLGVLVLETECLSDTIAGVSGGSEGLTCYDNYRAAYYYQGTQTLVVSTKYVSFNVCPVGGCLFHGKIEFYF